MSVNETSRIHCRYSIVWSVSRVKGGRGGVRMYRRVAVGDRGNFARAAGAPLSLLKKTAPGTVDRRPRLL